MKKILLCVLSILLASLCLDKALADKKPSKKEQPQPTPGLQIEGLPPEKAAELLKQLEALRKIETQLKYQQGVVPIGPVGKNLAKIKLSEDFRYLNPDDAQKVIVDVWG